VLAASAAATSVNEDGTGRAQHQMPAGRCHGHGLGLKDANGNVIARLFT